MICPYCSSPDTRVVDKRSSDEKSFRRRRECEKCEKRFTTYERIETIPLTVVKKDGSSESFDKNKIRMGIMRACEKRPVSQEKIEKILDDIENELMTMNTTEIKSKIIGDMVGEKLKALDEVAYIRFASVYKKFRDIESFEKELKELKRG
ncbi:MAG: transcriptional repressor NrdR [Candidatus Aenigmarchaeota archaeon]|nr:transcriptional repressor NrdR [Candidatus Aenigmarchaeota archaeon]